nr:ATP-binding protein [Melioribacteraceae bacterium]
MEKQIIEAQERYNRLLNHLTDYIYTVKVENGIAVETYHGPGCLAVTGYMSEDFDLNAELWYSMVHEDDKERVLQQAKDALAGKDKPPLEHRIYHRNGKLKWVKNSIVLSKNEDGKLLYYDGLINDITERKSAEELTEIKQNQLIHADKMVSIGTLTTGIAHEINNPNNFILLNVSVLSRVWNDIQPILNEYYKENGDFLLGGMVYSNSIDKIKNSIDGIYKGAVRIQKITQGLTNFAKKESDEYIYDTETDINEVIENAIMLTSGLIKKSTANFIVNYNKDIPKIKGNLQQLEQVIINLISNSCHALIDKNNRIEIMLKFLEDKKVIRIDVEDEGRGIEPEKLKHIFDPFYTTKREEGGTGLGLYISYNIIKRHGGEIWAKSIEKR